MTSWSKRVCHRQHRMLCTCVALLVHHDGGMPRAGSPTLAYHVQEPLTAHRQHLGFMSFHKFPQASRRACLAPCVGAAGWHL